MTPLEERTFPGPLRSHEYVSLSVQPCFWYYFSHAGHRRFPSFVLSDSEEETAEDSDATSDALPLTVTNSMLVWRFQHSWLETPFDTASAEQAVPQEEIRKAAATSDGAALATGQTSMQF